MLEKFEAVFSKWNSGKRRNKEEKDVDYTPAITVKDVYKRQVPRVHI